MPNFSSPLNYRKLVLSSRFVISPPGNGPDCHRTWEAMYLGAIPIVLRKSWPFAHLELPVLIVDTWDQIPEETERYVHKGEVSVDNFRWLRSWLRSVLRSDDMQRSTEVRGGMIESLSVHQ